MRRLTRSAIGVGSGIAMGAVAYLGAGPAHDFMQEDRAETLVRIDECASFLGETAITATELPKPCDEYFNNEFAHTTTEITEYDPETREYTSETETIYEIPSAETFKTDQVADTPTEAEDQNERNSFKRFGGILYGLLGVYFGYGYTRRPKKNDEDEAAAYAAPSTIKNAP